MKEHNCESCSRNVNGSVPIAVHENLRAQSNVDKRRLWIVVIILIVLLFGSNLAWLIYESQFETVTESIELTQENERGYNSYIGNDGDIYNGTADNQENNDAACP
jgi:hypothetical protein